MTLPAALQDRRGCKMLLRLLLLFTVVPIAELMLLIEIGRRIDVLPTIALVVATGVTGAALARREGLRTLTAIQADLNAGRLPGDRLIDALLILVAGALLITPGIMTDALGFALLIPPVRAFVRQRLKRRFRATLTMVDLSHIRRASDDDLIDVEARPHDEE